MSLRQPKTWRWMYGRIDLGTCAAGGPFVWSRWHWDWDDVSQ